MDDLRFEHELTFTEKDWVSLWQTRRGTRRSRGRLSRTARLGTVIVAGAACLFWSYTLLLGIAILSLVILTAVAPRVVPWGTRVMCEFQKHMVEPATYGVDRDGIWLRTPSLESRARWPLLISWQVRGDWLILSTSGMSLVLLPIGAMRKSGVFEPILELARKYGKEYK